MKSITMTLYDTRVKVIIYSILKYTSVCTHSICFIEQIDKTKLKQTIETNSIRTNLVTEPLYL